MPVRINPPARIADEQGTHEPGETVAWPSPALAELATAKTLNPETGAPYCEFVSTPATAAPATPADKPAPAAQPESEKP